MSEQLPIDSNNVINDSVNNNATNNVNTNVSNIISIATNSNVSEKVSESGEVVITYDNCAYIYDTLNILSTIQEQDKLTVSINQTISQTTSQTSSQIISQTIKQPIFTVDKPYMWQSVWRYWYGINRNMIIDYINEFIDNFLCVAIDNIIVNITSIKSEFVAKVRSYKEQRDNKQISSKLCKKLCKEASENVKLKLIPYNNVLNELIINIRNGAEGVKRLNITYSTDIPMIEKLTNTYNKLYSIADKCDKERVSGISLE